MIDTILNHRSIRQYKIDPVEDHLLTKILEAGTRASNTGNMQVYSMVVSKDEQKRKQLWESHFKQNMVLQAPVHITFCADFYRFTKWCEHRNATPGYDNFLSFQTAVVDAMLAAQNVTLAAEANGLGVCYLGTAMYNADKLIEILQLPKLVVPVTAIVLGYPNEEPSLTDRLPLEAVVHNETYGTFSKSDIDRLYAEKEAMELTQKLLEENQKETLAQIFTDNRYTHQNNLHFSQQYLKVLKEQGFMNQ